MQLSAPPPVLMEGPALVLECAAVLLGGEGGAVQSVSQYGHHAYHGMDSITPLDVCAPACMNGGSCSGPAQCTCASGWTGTSCQQGNVHNDACQSLMQSALQLYAALPARMGSAQHLEPVVVTTGGLKTPPVDAHVVRRERRWCVITLLLVPAVCSTLCAFGRCTQPEFCDCFMGWTRDSSGSCTQGISYCDKLCTLLTMLQLYATLPVAMGTVHTLDIVLVILDGHMTWMAAAHRVCGENYRYSVQ